MKQTILTQYIDEAVRAQAFPGGQFFVKHQGEVLLDTALGTVDYQVPTADDVYYDIASLTKLFTWTLLLQRIELRTIRLDDPVQRFLPEFPNPNTTLWHLCTHTSGIRENFHEYYFQNPESMEHALRTVVSTPGTTCWYSCANTMLAGLVLESLCQTSLEVLVMEQICVPLSMYQTTFKPNGVVAPTEQCPVRGLVRGTVHDEKVHTLGRSLGNAGLFSTARDLSIFLEEWISGKDVLAPNTKVQSWENQLSEGTIGQGLGWLRDRISVRGSTHYPGMIAHAGFTGCQMLYWPQQQLEIIMVTNRIYPHRSGPSFTQIVEGFIALVLQD